MAKLSRDYPNPVGGTSLLHPRETVIGTGTLASVNAEVPIPVDGCSTVTLDLRGTFSGTFSLEGTVDGTNYTLIPVRPINTATISYVVGITGTTQGIWVGKAAPFRSVRVRCTAYTSGSAIATLIGDSAPLDDSLQGMVTPSLVTATGAAAAAVTLTIPSPGAGLRNYITYLRIGRFATTLLTAAATPVLVTTTNIPGSLVFSVPAEAAPQGTLTSYQEDFAYPVASTAQGTATTIVAPVTTGVIWRLTAGYYVAP